MKLITAQEARTLTEKRGEWRQNHMLELMELTMADIEAAAMAEKSSIVIEAIAASVNLPAFLAELSSLGFTVQQLDAPWFPRSVEILW